MLDKPIGQVGQDFYRFLVSDAVLGQIADRLPEHMKGAALQLVSRAKSHFTKRLKSDKRFRECTCKSLIECICEAAEFGFALDGVHCYAVPYGDQAQFIPGYRGMVSAARRAGLIEDAWARVVMDGDTLRLSEVDGRQRYEYEPDLAVPRSYEDCKGVLAVVRAKGEPRWEWLTRHEVDALRLRSQAKDFGPWKTDAEEMAKKAGLRRILKTFSDDPTMARLCERDDEASNLFSALLSKPASINATRRAEDVLAEVGGLTREATR